MSTALFTLPPCTACAGRGYTRSYDGERQACLSCLGSGTAPLADELGYDEQAE